MKLQQNLTNKLRHKIEFCQENLDADSHEQKWQSIKSTYAEIKPLCEASFREIDDVSFGHIATEELFLITIRYDRDLNQNLRIKFGDRFFSIKRIINPFEMNIVLRILAIEIR